MISHAAQAALDELVARDDPTIVGFALAGRLRPYHKLAALTSFVLRPKDVCSLGNKTSRVLR